jgi:hypothetical protein
MGVPFLVNFITLSLNYNPFHQQGNCYFLKKLPTWDYIILKIFCTAKEIISGKTRKPLKWEKTFANHISDKGLISREDYYSLIIKR